MMMMHYADAPSTRRRYLRLLNFRPSSAEAILRPGWRLSWRTTKASLEDRLSDTLRSQLEDFFGCAVCAFARIRLPLSADQCRLHTFLTFRPLPKFRSVLGHLICPYLLFSAHQTLYLSGKSWKLKKFEKPKKENFIWFEQIALGKCGNSLCNRLSSGGGVWPEWYSPSPSKPSLVCIASSTGLSTTDLLQKAAALWHPIVAIRLIQFGRTRSCHWNYRSERISVDGPPFCFQSKSISLSPSGYSEMISIKLNAESKEGLKF